MHESGLPAMGRILCILQFLHHYESCYKSIAELGDLYERAMNLTGDADDWITLYETIAHPQYRSGSPSDGAGRARRFSYGKSGG